jgi:hypothetical protein
MQLFSAKMQTKSTSLLAVKKSRLKFYEKRPKTGRFYMGYFEVNKV